MIVDMIVGKQVLVVNPNTTAAVTERFVEACQRAAGEGAVFEGVTGRFGADIVTTQAEEIIAGHAALELVAENWKGHDAVILAISFDTALDAARELVPIPVIGITEASIEAASLLGPVGLVTFGAASRPLYDWLVVRRGFASRVIGIETIETGSSSDYLSTPTQGLGTIAARARGLVHAGAKAIVVCGAALAGCGDELTSIVGTPVFDAAAPAARRALMLAQHPSDAGRRTRSGSTITGVAPGLAALVGGDEPSLPSLPSSPSTSFSERNPSCQA